MLIGDAIEESITTAGQILADAEQTGKTSEKQPAK